VVFAWVLGRCDGRLVLWVSRTPVGTWDNRRAHAGTRCGVPGILWAAMLPKQVCTSGGANRWLALRTVTVGAYSVPARPG
jgi:hypothetical protein